MDWHAAGLRRLDGIIWAVIAGVAGVACWPRPLYGFHLVADSFVAPAGASLLLWVAPSITAAAATTPISRPP